MASFGVGSAVSSASRMPRRRARLPRHPSAPIPVQGPPLGQGIRVALGEAGAEIFPLILGGAEFGWNVDLESSHEILDAYVELGGNAVHTADSFSGGRSEHIIGQWLRSRGLRDEIVLGGPRRRAPRQPGPRSRQPRARGRGLAHTTRHRPHRRASTSTRADSVDGSRRHPRHRGMARRVRQGAGARRCRLHRRAARRGPHLRLGRLPPHHRARRAVQRAAPP